MSVQILKEICAITCRTSTTPAFVLKLCQATAGSSNNLIIKESITSAKEVLFK